MQIAKTYIFFAIHGETRRRETRRAECGEENRFTTGKPIVSIS